MLFLQLILVTLSSAMMQATHLLVGSKDGIGENMGSIAETGYDVERDPFSDMCYCCDCVIAICVEVPCSQKKNCSCCAIL